MKKVLFASTALVAFAGTASADITLSGFAEMGISRADSLAVATPSGSPVTSLTTLSSASIAVVDGVTGFHTDINVTFTMSGETDGGLVFGASVDLEDKIAGGDATGNDAEDGGVSMFISGAFGTLTAGDTDGALDWALQEVIFNGGSINAASEHAGYNGNSGLDGLYDGQIVRYDYAVGDVAFALSAELDDSDNPLNDDVMGIGFKYSVNLGGTDVALGLGYQSAALEDDGTLGTSTDVDALGFSANATFANGLTAGLSYVKYGNHAVGGGAVLKLLESSVGNGDGVVVTNGLDSKHIGVGVGYTTGAYSASLNYGKYDAEDYGYEVDGFGLALGYDLGGGASLQFGYGKSTFEDVATGNDVDIDNVSLGLRMNF